MSDFPGALPHGELTEVFSNLWSVKGQILIGQDPPTSRSRNMTVVREGDELTLLNTVRLDDAGLEALGALGTVRHIVKLGSYHGRDDAFYVARYPEATLWAPPGMPYERALATDRELTPTAVPVSDAVPFVFETANNVEALLLLERDGGILIPCDSLQNWEEPDDYFDEESTRAMHRYFGRARIGFGWLEYASPEAADFARLSKLEFAHLLPAHGTPILDAAGEALRATFREAFAE